jgi:transcription elongation GreA/GreB family factor
MPDLLTLKLQLYQYLLTQLDEKIARAQSAMASAREARDSETKSSVGDKYETGRAMMQTEMAQQEVQLQKALQLKAELSRVNMEKKYTVAEFGSLVLTNRGSYFICIGAGQIKGIEGTHYAISPASPIGQLLLGKKAGDTFRLQGGDYLILDLV